MSGRYYGIIGQDYFICNKCESFDVLSSIEANHNPPICRNCKSRDVRPNELFNSYKFKEEIPKIKDINGKYIIEGVFCVFDGSDTKKKRNKLMKKFGKNLKEYNRKHNIDKLLE
jgi:hypothetical protein